MKKLLIGIAALGIISQAAYASQARLIALGLDELDNEGSYYIQDSRNIFLNAAAVNNYADMAIVELGGLGRNVSANETSYIDQDNKTKAQGGFLKKHGNYVYGVYLGNESNTSSFLRVASMSNAAAFHDTATTTPGQTPLGMPTADNQLDLFLGSTFSSGVKWGANLVYLDNEDETKAQDDKAGALRLGLMASNWTAHANISFMNEAKNTVSATPVSSLAGIGEDVTQEFEGKLGIHLGGSYSMGQNTLYGFYKTFKWDQKDSYSQYAAWTGLGQGERAGKLGTSEGSFDTYVLGLGRVESVNTNGNIFTNVHVKKVDVELKLASTVQVDNLTVPLTLGYEHQANSWLMLRGSITHNLYGKKDNKNFTSANVVAKSLVENVYGTEGKGTIQNSTRVNAGATLTFGKLTVDGVIGATTNNRAGTTDGSGNDTTVSANSSTQSGTLTLDNFMSRVAVTYMF